MSAYPRTNDNGETVWACCESSIGQPCQHRTPAPQSGYTPRACRDCMDITVSSDTTRPELCEACREAGCEDYNSPEAVFGSTHLYDCQRTDAYEGA